MHDLFSPLGVPAPPHEPAGSGPGPHGAGPPPSTPAAPPARPAGPGNPAGGPTPSPTPDLVALCRGYLATLDAHGQPDPAVRQQLAAVAGDAHKIPEFCTRLLRGGDASGGGGHHAHSATGPSSPP